MDRKLDREQVPKSVGQIPIKMGRRVLLRFGVDKGISFELVEPFLGFMLICWGQVDVFWVLNGVGHISVH